MTMGVVLILNVKLPSTLLNQPTTQTAKQLMELLQLSYKTEQNRHSISEHKLYKVHLVRIHYI